jgi:hypothetical protein
MSNRKANGTVNIAVSAAVYRDVRGAVWQAVYRGVNRDVYVAWDEDWGVWDDPDHPALQDLLVSFPCGAVTR